MPPIPKAATALARTERVYGGTVRQSPEQTLAGAVLRQAFLDARRGYAPARAWFRHGDGAFKLWCDVLDTNPESLRHRVLARLGG